MATNKNIMENPNDYCLFLHIKKIDRLLTSFLNRKFIDAGIDIRSTQFSLLNEFRNVSERNLTEVSRDLCMDRTTLSRNSESLQKRGFLSIDKMSDGKDKREMKIVCHQSAKDVCDQAINIWSESNQEISEILDLDKLKKALKSIISIMDKSKE